jgi:hypothetical protein
MGFSREAPSASGSNEATTAGQDLIRHEHSAHASGQVIAYAPTRGFIALAATVERDLPHVGHAFWNISGNMLTL